MSIAHLKVCNRYHQVFILCLPGQWEYLLSVILKGCNATLTDLTLRICMSKEILSNSNETKIIFLQRMSDIWNARAHYGYKYYELKVLILFYHESVGEIKKKDKKTQHRCLWSYDYMPSIDPLTDFTLNQPRSPSWSMQRCRQVWGYFVRNNEIA